MSTSLVKEESLLDALFIVLMVGSLIGTWMSTSIKNRQVQGTKYERNK